MNKNQTSVLVVVVVVALVLVGIYFFSCKKECKFDNSSLWTPTAPGVYNCIGDCVPGKNCWLMVKGPGAGAVWRSLGVKQIARPAGMQSPTDDPNTYKCTCQ